jgi:hypothetical protein
VYGDEQSIQTLHRVNVGNAEIKELGTKRSPESRAKEPSRWIWRTKRVSIDPAELEEQLASFTSNLINLPDEWRRAALSADERSLTMIVQLDAGSAMESVSLSATTIQDLAVLNASFDIDCVSMME